MMKKTKRHNSSFKGHYIAVILGLLSMTFLIYMGTTLGKRAALDFTEEGLYTLSEGSRSILTRLDSPVKLKLYYSKTAANKGSEGLRSFNNHFRYVRELLREYVDHSKNNLDLEVIDPRPDTPDEEDAMAYGMKKFNITQTESYFFGLVAENESGTEKIIEFFDPNQKDKLEYEITKLIFTVLKPQKKKVGILSSLDVLREDTSPYIAQIMRMQGKKVQDSWIVTKLLKEFFQVQKIAKDAETISGIETLIIIHPTGFPEKTLRAIDQFLLKGGKILVFVDPNAISDTSKMGMGMGMGGGLSSSPDKGFRTLMDNWGITVMPNTYAGDKHLSGLGQTRSNSPPGRLLALLQCNEKCTGPYRDVISSGVTDATFVFPGVLKKKEVKGKGITVSPIMSTSEKGNSYTAHGFELSNPGILWNKFKEGQEPVVIAYKAVGKFQSAYSKDLVKGNKKNNKEGKESKESAVVVFSDVDFIHDQFAFRNTFLGPTVANGNSTLFLNAVESLSGDANLMSVRSKGRINRSFDVVDAIELEAEKRTAAKVNQINGSIMRFQSELNQLGRKAKGGNIALLQNEGLRKKKNLAKQIAKLKRELRNVKREGREKIEGIGKFFQYLNTLFVPFFIVVGGSCYFRKRGRLIQKGDKERGGDKT